MNAKSKYSKHILAYVLHTEYNFPPIFISEYLNVSICKTKSYIKIIKKYKDVKVVIKDIEEIKNECKLYGCNIIDENITDLINVIENSSLFKPKDVVCNLFDYINDIHMVQTKVMSIMDEYPELHYDSDEFKNLCLCILDNEVSDIKYQYNIKVYMDIVYTYLKLN